MENEGVNVAERLAEWKRKFDARLGPGITQYGSIVAEGCFLACDTLPSAESEPNPYPSPLEAVVSITQIGPRPRSRPPTARPAEYAAYIFKQTIANESDVVREYLEALLGPGTALTPWEVSQRLRRRHKEAKEIAQRVSAAFVQQLTIEQLKEEYRDACSLLEREKDSLLPGMKQQIVWSMSARMVLFPLIKAGKLNHFNPLVSVMGARRAGKYTFGGSNFSVSGMTVSFDLNKGLNEPYAWAKILSLPVWYPPWVGEIPLEIRLSGPLLRESLDLGRQQTKKSTPHPKASKPRGRNRSRGKQ
jgi:hypothetical protein